MATDPLWMRDVQNAHFMTYDPTKGWQGYTQDMGNFRNIFNDQQFNLAPEIQAYLAANGYSGPLQGALQEMAPAADDLAANTDRQSRADWMQQNIGRSTSAPVYGGSRIPELDAYLQQHGLTLQSGFTKDPKATQTNQIQRLLDASGNPVAVDAHIARNAGIDKFMNFAVPTMVALGTAAVGGQAMGLMGGGGAGAGAQLGAGSGAGGAAAGGGGLGSAIGQAAASGFAQGMGGAAAGAGGLSAGNVLAGLGAAGTGVLSGSSLSTPNLTTPGLEGVTQGLGLSNPAPLQLAPSIVGPGAATAASAAEALKAAGGSGLLDTIKNSGAGKAVGAVADLVGGGGNLAAIVGGALGATQGGKTDTATVSRNLDPRIDAALFGNGGYLSQLQQQFNATKGGNADMTAGADMLRNLYQSPQYAQGYEQMRSVGQGLLGQGVAANPFTNPGSAPAGLLGAFQPVARGQMPTGLLPVPTRRGSV